MPVLEGMPDESSQKGSRCSIGVILQALEPADRTKLEEWLTAKNPVGEYRYTGTSIAVRLSQAMGYRVSYYSINRHRRAGKEGGCLCGTR